jgi:hypothetical protein
MSTTSRGTPNEHRAAAPGPIAEFGVVRTRHALQVEGHRIPSNTQGTVVAVYGDGTACAVEIADRPGGADVVTLRADQIERIP